MSKKKAKKPDLFDILELKSRLDEVIDLLHVLVDQTKKPEPVNINPRYDVNVTAVAEALRERPRQFDLQVAGYKPGDRRTPGKVPTSIAAEEVEDYHGKASTDPYSGLPPYVRIHQ